MTYRDCGHVWGNRLGTHRRSPHVCVRLAGHAGKHYCAKCTYGEPDFTMLGDAERQMAGKAG